MRIEQTDFSHPMPDPAFPRAEQNFRWRQNNFANAMLHYGVVGIEQGRPKFSPEKLQNITSSTELSMLYGLSLPWTRDEKYIDAEQYGSILFQRKIYLPDEPKILQDVHRPAKNITLSKGDIIWMTDFIPFTNLYGAPELALESMFIGSVDFARLLLAKTYEKDIPKVLEGVSNAVNANFVTRHWRFGFLEAYDTGMNQHGNEIREIKDADQITEHLKKALKSRLKPDHSIMYHLFADPEDIFTTEFVAQLLETSKLLYERAVKTGKTEAKDVEAYERELRINAILMNVEMQKKMGYVPNPREMHDVFPRQFRQAQEISEPFLSHPKESVKHKKKAKQVMRKKSQKRNRK